MDLTGTLIDQLDGLLQKSLKYPSTPKMPKMAGTAYLQTTLGPISCVKRGAASFVTQICNYTMLERIAGWIGVIRTLVCAQLAGGGVI
jgi:hypothetical protein